MELEKGESSSIEFEKGKRDPANISGEWRLATVDEVRNNLHVIKEKAILQSWDIARLLDGWVDGPGYRYTISREYKELKWMGEMLLVKTKVSRDMLGVKGGGYRGRVPKGSKMNHKEKYSGISNPFFEEMYSGISLTPEGRKTAVLLSCDDKIAEVLFWVLRNVESQEELDGLKKSMEETFHNGRTILHYAADHAANGQHGLGVAKLLMNETRFEYGKELVKLKDKYGRTALHIAAFHGHTKLCEFLIVQGKLKMDEMDRNGENPFHLAVSGNKVDSVQGLFDLMNSLEEEDKRVMQSAIFAGDAKGKTPLHKAAAHGSKEMIEALLDPTSIKSPWSKEMIKKYIRKSDWLGETALHEAAREGHTETVEFLLQEGSYPLVERNADGKTALHYAVQLQDVTSAKKVADLLLGRLESVEHKTLYLWASATGVGTAEESAKGEVRNFLKRERNSLQKILDNKKRAEGSSNNLLRTAIEEGLESMVWELITRGGDTQQIMDKSWKDSLHSKQRQRLHNFIRHTEAMPDRGRDQPTLDDSLGRNPFAEGLAALFLNPFVKTPVAVGISGEWGMGKSSLMVQTEIALLKAAAQLAFPNLHQIEEFPGSKKLKLTKHGRRKYKEIKNAVKHLLVQSTLLPTEDPLVHFLENYQQRYHDVYRSLAVMDRSEMFQAIGATSESRTQVDGLGKIPAILTVQYNAWHYQSEFEAWAGLAVEITKVIEETMNTAQTIRTCCRYAWNEQRAKMYLVLILPCLLVSLIAGWIAWAAWLLISRSNNKELANLKYGCIPVTVVTIAWTVLRQLFRVLKPISDQIMAYVHLPDHSGNLGYQQKVISDIKFLKIQIGEKPSWLWKFIGGRWCWNWFGLYSDTVKGTQIPKLPPASMDDLRIIVFVDDLDRCQDTVILQVLSAVNLVLAACEINVILGMDKRMIARAIANKFEHGDCEIQAEDPMDLANKYISKIVQLPLALPDPNDDETKNFLDQQLGVVSEDVHSDAEEEANGTEMAGQTQSSPEGAGHVAVDVDKKEPERSTGFFSTLWSKVSRLQPCRAFKNYSSLLQKSNGTTTETPSKHLQGAPLESLLQMSNYSPGEREALSSLRKVATDVQKLPREWKRFLTYHRLAWNILSKSGQVKSLPGWQVQLVVWIFCCWQWKDQMNTIIEKWQALSLMKDDLLEGKASDGPSLRNIVENYIEMLKRETMKDEKGIEMLKWETMKEETRHQWKKLEETLSRFDVSMDCIQAFQKFRLHCEVGHLQWPLDGI